MTTILRVLVIVAFVPITVNGAEPGSGEAVSRIARFLTPFRHGAFVSPSNLVEEARRQGLTSRQYLDECVSVLTSTNYHFAYDEAATILCAAGQNAKHCTTTLLSSAEAASLQHPNDGRNGAIYQTVVAINWPLDENTAQKILHSMMGSYRKGKDATLLMPIAQLLLLREDYASALHFLYEYAAETSAGGCTDYDLQLWLQSLCLAGVGKFDESIQALMELSRSGQWGSWFHRHPISKMTLRLIPGEGIREKRKAKKIVFERILVLEKKMEEALKGRSGSLVRGARRETKTSSVPLNEE